MLKTILVTGASGFVGTYFCEYIKKIRPDLTLVAMDIRKSLVPCDSFIVSDFISDDNINSVILEYKPGVIIHLAGIFGTDDMSTLYKINVIPVVKILESMRFIVPNASFITAGSAAEYGRPDSSLIPISESCPCVPISAYGQSKHLATQITQFYHTKYGMSTMVIRPFQLLGNGVPERLAPGAFARRIKDAILNNREKIKVGNLESSRDFLDVRDAVRAIWMLSINPSSGDIFNLCSSKPIKMYNLLDMMLRVSGADLEIETEAELLKGQDDVDIIYGDNSQIRKIYGWAPQIGLEDSLRDMF